MELLILISDAAHAPWARATAAACGAANPTLITGSPAQAASALEQQQQSAPTHIILDLGVRGPDVFPEIDALAQQCKVGTRVIAVGTNPDPLVRRGLLSRGILDYCAMPCEPAVLAAALMAHVPRAAAPATPVAKPVGAKQVVAFVAAASGDGASTAALNTAMAMSRMYKGKTVLIDADYQYGMIAQQLNIENHYGIRELFEHPERGIDATMIERLVIPYNNLHVITAPSELRFLPDISTETITRLITSLQPHYDRIIIDLPHLWTPWIATILQHSTQVVLVAQLWLKSVSHAARMTRTVRELGIPMDRLVPVINRSGAKFKEAVKPKDFERVCGAAIRYTLANDIRTVTASETAAKTVLELGDSPLKSDILRLAAGLTGKAPPADSSKSGLFTRFK